MEEGGYGPNFWRTYSKLLEDHVVVDAIRIAKRKFHEKRRKEDRRKYSEYLARQYELLEMKKYGTFIKSSLGERTEQYNLEHVNLDGETFTTHPMECHNIATEVMHVWHEAPKDYRGTIHHSDFDWKGCTEEVKPLMDIARGMNIPVSVASTIADAFQEVPRAYLVRAQLEDELPTPHTFAEFYHELKNKPNNKSGGVSGSTYENMKSWSDAHLLEIYENIAKLWGSKYVPQWWSKKYICIVPKDVSNPGNLNTCRPITLVEVMRKL